MLRKTGLKVLGGLAFLTLAGSAQALTPPSKSMTAAEGSAIERVHGYHCNPKWSPRLGWHRHWGACHKWHYLYPQHHHYWHHHRWHHHKWGAPRWL